MPKDEFRNLCKSVWEKPHGFVVIDLSSKIMAESIEEDLTIPICQKKKKKKKKKKTHYM